MKKYALFDMDGTVIAKDSFFLLLKYCLKRSPLRTLLIPPAFFFISLYRKELPSRNSIKSAALWSITVGITEQKEIELFGRGGVLSKLATPYIFQEVADLITNLRAEKHEIVYVSASTNLWVDSVVSQFDKDPYQIIATKVKKKWGGYILDGNNCYGSEKVRRIAKELTLDAVFEKGYTDSRADIPMICLCKEKFLINPNKKNLSAFEKIFSTKGFVLLNYTIPV